MVLEDTISVGVTWSERRPRRRMDEGDVYEHGRGELGVR